MAPAGHAAGGTKAVLRPLAVEWGGQALAGAGGTRLNFALATNLAKACDLLDVDLVLEHNDGVTPFWGQVGHYSIATAAVEAVNDKPLAALLAANRERISFVPDELSADAIRAKPANGDFVDLADMPDLVWKKLPSRVPGGRGVHATYEDKMVDRFSAPLLAAIGPAALGEAGGAIPPIGNGQDAAFATIKLMDFSARTIPPAELCDLYIALGGGTLRPVV